MSRVIWSPAALLDVQRLYRFLAPQNIDAAKQAVKALRKGVKVLQLQSGIGRPIDDMPEEFREWIIDFGDSGYVARYRIDSEVVMILAARHQKEVEACIDTALKPRSVPRPNLYPISVMDFAGQLFRKCVRDSAQK